MTGSKNQTVLLYGTCSDMESGRDIARSLLQARLVACVNLLPGATSLYRWQGAVQEGAEVLFIAKSAKSCWPEASKLFARLHPYDEPALVQLEIADGLAGFLDWIAGETLS